ncbi:MAG: S8 family serine peptidase [Sphingomicrobium sp.]
MILHTYSSVVKGFAVRLPADPGRGSVTARLRSHNPNVSACEHDGITRAAAVAAGKPIGFGGQTLPWGVSRIGGPADASSLARRAWIIDSGIDLTHPDLNVDVADGASLLSGDSSLNDTYGHGTHVAGIIAAKDNAIGVVGVAAGAQVVPIRVLDGTGTGPDSGVVAALDYVSTHASAGDVANLSLIADAVSDIMDQAVANLGAKGVFVVIAAGNNSANASNYSPGRTNATNVFTVSAFGSRDTWASFSNYGTAIDWSEPGVNVPSTYKNGGYATLSGTSMAAPHLAGLLLLQGSARSGGLVKRDPDGNPDSIGVK